MKDSNTPATKADIQEILKKVDERIGGLDESLNRKLDEFRGEMNQKLGEIDRQLRVLVEQTHFNLSEASHDAEEVIKDHGRRLEKRVAHLEKVVGIAAA